MWKRIIAIFWCHRGMQKTAPIKKMNLSFADHLYLMNFDSLCDCVDCGLEIEKEHVLLMKHIRACTKIQYREGLLSDSQLEELNY